MTPSFHHDPELPSASGKRVKKWSGQKMGASCFPDRSDRAHFLTQKYDRASPGTHHEPGNASPKEDSARGHRERPGTRHYPLNARVSLVPCPHLAVVSPWRLSVPFPRGGSACIVLANPGAMSPLRLVARRSWHCWWGLGLRTVRERGQFRVTGETDARFESSDSKAGGDAPLFGACCRRARSGHRI